MAEGFITRRGGVAAGTTQTPTVNFVSKTDSTIVFTLTNNDEDTATIFWEVGVITQNANQVIVSGQTTTGNITASGLDNGTEYTIFAIAQVDGKKISGSSSITQTTDVIIFTSATGGNTITYEESGKFYKSHTFLTSGNFVVNQVGNDDRNQVDYLVIGGGGSGGGFIGAGGGAGGYRTTLGTSGANSSPESKIVVTTQTYGVTVGAGGAFTNSVPTNGNNSSVFNITSLGGGASAPNIGNGNNGGSGGGGGFENQGTIYFGGLGTNNQGFNGGGGNTTSSPTTSERGATGGGGGAGEAGGNAANRDNGGKGGDGLGNTLRTGLVEFRGGGGGGGIGRLSTGSVGLGGLGGGGNGGKQEGSPNGQPGAVNTGGGAGRVATGGSGIVIIRYEVGGL